ncbi:hypothetical protein ACDI59_28400, partial [Klebsiella pneumoniae]|uniref:hypothetical protein n=1 Tax=Klebsiella pneumoniae TaxID=573 RepID=UPI00353234C4
QSHLLKITYKQTCQKAINWVRIWLVKLGKLTLGKTKTEALVLCHEDIMNMQFGLMTNHRTLLANFQKQALENFNWEMCQKVIFGKCTDIKRYADGFVMTQELAHFKNF